MQWIKAVNPLVILSSPVVAAAVTTPLVAAEISTSKTSISFPIRSPNPSSPRSSRHYLLLIITTLLTILMPILLLNRIRIRNRNRSRTISRRSSISRRCIISTRMISGMWSRNSPDLPPTRGSPRLPLFTHRSLKVPDCSVYDRLHWLTLATARLPW